jgi:hypothetical protein
MQLIEVAMLNFARSAFAIFASLLLALSASAAIPVKVVVVSMFENGEVTGDKAGEHV